MSLKQKWQLILKIALINAVAVPVLFFLDIRLSESASIPKLKEIYQPFFMPFSAFWSFFRIWVFETALNEEVVFRGLIWILAAIGFTKFEKRLGETLTQIIFISALIVPTIFWSFGHPIFASVFWAGVSWGYLTIETKELWPAVFSHMLANISIYFLIKALSVFGLV